MSHFIYYYAECRTVFFNRGPRFDVDVDDDKSVKNRFDAIRIFVWPRKNVVGNKDPADFVVAVCELSSQVLML